MYYIISCCLLIILGCKKEMKDGRGVVVIDTYSVSDSIVDPFQTSFYSSYDIEISSNSSNPNEVFITNYANIKNTQNVPLTVIAKVSGNVIDIESQLIQGPSGHTVDYIQVNQSFGYFSNDSVYFHISYSDKFDPYHGDCWGKKQN